MMIPQQSISRTAVLLLAVTIGAVQPAFASPDDAASPLRTSPIDDVQDPVDSIASVSLKLDFSLDFALDFAEGQRSLERVQHVDSSRTGYRMQTEDLRRADRVALGMLRWQDGTADTRTWTQLRNQKKRSTMARISHGR